MLLQLLVARFKKMTQQTVGSIYWDRVPISSRPQYLHCAQPCRMHNPNPSKTTRNHEEDSRRGDSCQSLDTVMFYTFIHPLQSSKFFTQIFYLTFYRDPWIPVCWQTQNYKWQNGKRYKGKPNRVQSALARRMRQGCTGPPPPLTPVLHRVAAKLRFCNLAKFSCFTKFSSNFAKIKIILSKFCVSQKFDKIIFNFAKFEEKFCETRN